MKLIYTILLLFSIEYSFSQKPSQEFEGVENEIIHLIEKYNAVGAAVAVVKNDRIIYAKGFGYRDIERKLPVTTNTVFPIGSITKSFTGSVLGALEAEEKLSLKDKPSQHIPEFAFYNDKMNDLITIEDLLSHKSGIGNQASSQVFFPDTSLLKMVQRLRYLKPQAEVKNSFEYSNMAYTVAGAIIEQITGNSWQANIQEKLFTPLEMTSSYTKLEEMKKSSDYSFPYGVYNGNVEKVKYEDFNSISPAGAIKSTVNDMTNWMITWLNNGKFKDSQIISEEYIQKATTLQNIKGGNYEENAFLFGDGFGWRLRSSYGHFRIEHGGNTFGFSSDLAMFPFDKIGIVVLTNQDNSLLPYAIVDIITRRLFEIDPVPEYPINVADIFKPMPYKHLNKDKMPSHSLSSYSGTYTAKGFGTIEVLNEDERLYALLPNYKFQLEHVNYDSFFFKPSKEFKDVYNPQFTIQFITDTEGEISMLKMYSQKEPVQFYKVD